MPVERHVKERLIGAAVLVAAAVILVPEMLSGPDRGSTQADSAATPAAAGDVPLKTYTIDLNRSPATEPAAGTTEVIADQAPPPEVALDRSGPAPADQPIPESRTGDPAGTQSAPAAEAAGEVASVPAQPAPPRESAAVASAAAALPARAAAPDTAVKDRPVPSGAGWAVQLGSFASQATAGNMTKQLREEGYDAFVMPVKNGATTLYRVRIGPMPDRDSANQTLSRIKPKVPAATVVKHP